MPTTPPPPKTIDKQTERVKDTLLLKYIFSTNTDIVIKGIQNTVSEYSVKTIFMYRLGYTDTFEKYLKLFFFAYYHIINIV